MGKAKKLLYITRYSLHQNFNLQKKFDGQLNAFRSLGFEVYFIGFDEKHLYLVNGQEKTVIGNTHFRFPAYLHTQFYNDLHKAAIKAIESVGFDFVYWRTAPLWNSSCKVANAIKNSGARLIYEIPTFPPSKESYTSVLRRLFSIYSRTLSKKFDPLVDYYVVIGEDAGGEYKGKPAINIENGIDISNISVRTPDNSKDEIHILALASMCYWHGYDRLIKSLAKYNGDKKVIVHMVGGNDGGYLDEWKELSKTLGLTDSVVYHGPMSGQALEEMFDLCDVGINSLAMYRKGFKVTMELKTREYVSRGLPFVCAVDDPALESCESPMWLKVANDNSIPDMNQIVDFAIKMKQNPSHVQKLRAIAEDKMTWDIQYRKVFDVVGGI